MATEGQLAIRVSLEDVGDDGELTLGAGGERFFVEAKEDDEGLAALGVGDEGGVVDVAACDSGRVVGEERVEVDLGDFPVVLGGGAQQVDSELGGLVAGESVVVIGPGPIGLLAVAVAKSLGASPVVLVGTRENRNKIGLELGADYTINPREVEDVVEEIKNLVGPKGADYVVDCAGNEATVNQAVHMTNRGGKVCLAAFPKKPVEFDLGYLAVNNIYLYGIRGEGRSATHRAMAFMAEKRFDATKVHTHTFPMTDLPEALRYARERVDDAIKVVVTNAHSAAASAAAE